MTQTPISRLTRFRLFWEALDAVMTRRGLPPPNFEAARDWFEAELEPEAVGDLLEAHTPVANEASLDVRARTLNEDKTMDELAEAATKEAGQ